MRHRLLKVRNEMHGSSTQPCLFLFFILLLLSLNANGTLHDDFHLLKECVLCMCTLFECPLRRL